MKHETTFIANPTQRAFIESRAEADLFASRKGEGKSAGLCWAAYYYTHHNPGANLVMLRDTWENLQRTTLDEWFRWFPNGVYGDWINSQRTWYWNTKRTGLSGKVYFLGAESKEDAQRIASMPLAGGLFDEPAPAANSSAGIDEFVFDTVMGQLRQPGMKWYIAKLATNNPDQTHWTYKRFVKPGTPPNPSKPHLPMQELGYRCWQTKEPENVANLPPGYYESMAERWRDRQDLLRRFVEGKFGFQSKGKAVTPEWNDDIHLASGLKPISGLPVKLMWDGGQHPACVVSQISPVGDWLILDAFYGEGYGIYELIRDVVRPRLLDKYPWVRTISKGIEHTGDPNLQSPDQSTSSNDAVKVILKELGGSWFPGPVSIEDRVNPLREVLRRIREGRGLMTVDRDNAEAVWFALRGGWHYRISRTGIVGQIEKDHPHSDIGDCMGYGAARWYPTGRLVTKKSIVDAKVGNYYDSSPGKSRSFIKSASSAMLPSEARVIGAGNRELPNKW